MKWFCYSAVSLLSGLLFFHFTSAKKELRAQFSYVKTTAISCAPDRDRLFELLDGIDICPLPGSGNHHWKISSASDSAQFYFDQGINTYYGFHIIESLASFKKAARFDPKNPMVWWGLALALGPNINDVGYAASAEALTALEKAKIYMLQGTTLEKMLIRAMSVRYTADSTRARAELNEEYKNEMGILYRRFPTHPDVAALYADAMMLQHPWDLWNNNGTPKPWTPHIKTVLERLLTNAPQHPGANHYYIHVMEASPFADKALPSANRLGNISPGLSHLVHMPSHIFLRTGQFATGSAVNERAIDQFRLYSSLLPAVNENAFLYQWHNQHMQANCAMLAGRSEYALKAAKDLRAAIDTSALSLPPPIGNYLQYMRMTPVLLNIRFARWDDLLNMEMPLERHIYSSIIFHLGRGMAYATRRNFAAAEKERKTMTALMQDFSLTISDEPFSPPLEGAKCAERLLAGYIEIQQGHTGDAIAALEQAVTIESNMVYNEPRDWFLSPRPYLGKAYLAAGKWVMAQTVFENDLQVNKNNIWSLYGLEQSLLKQKKLTQAKKIKSLQSASVGMSGKEIYAAF